MFYLLSVKSTPQECLELDVFMTHGHIYALTFPFILDHFSQPLDFFLIKYYFPLWLFVQINEPNCSCFKC